MAPGISPTLVIWVLPRSKSKEVCPHSFLSQISSDFYMVASVVRSRMDDDGKPIRASAVTIAVRCYEARIGRLGVVQSNILFESCQTLWSKSVGSDWESLGDVDLPFKFIIPPECTAPGAVVFPEYRIVWRIEASASFSFRAMYAL